MQRPVSRVAAVLGLASACLAALVASASDSRYVVRQSVLAVAGTYATHVTLLPDSNSCGAVTVEDGPTTVTHTPGARTLSLAHAGNAYVGSVDDSGRFATPTATISASGSRYRLTIVGRFSRTGFDARVHVAVQQPAPPPTCAYNVHWVGAKNGPPNTLP
jgi:hypothetical protein